MPDSIVRWLVNQRSPLPLSCAANTIGLGESLGYVCNQSNRCATIVSLNNIGISSLPCN